jgi:hypothetical protein
MVETWRINFAIESYFLYIIHCQQQIFYKMQKLRTCVFFPICMLDFFTNIL